MRNIDCYREYVGNRIKCFNGEKCYRKRSNNIGDQSRTNYWDWMHFYIKGESRGYFTEIVGMNSFLYINQLSLSLYCYNFGGILHIINWYMEWAPIISRWIKLLYINYIINESFSTCCTNCLNNCFIFLSRIDLLKYKNYRRRRRELRRENQWTKWIFLFKWQWLQQRQQWFEWFWKWKRGWRKKKTLDERFS